MIKTGSRRRSGPREDQLLQHRARLADAIKQGVFPSRAVRAGRLG